MFPVSWSGLINNVVQIGLTVSAAALVLFLLRRVMKKRYPARAICFVWALLAIRLLIPVAADASGCTGAGHADPGGIQWICRRGKRCNPRRQAAAADETQTPRVSVYPGGRDVA